MVNDNGRYQQRRGQNWFLSRTIQQAEQERRCYFIFELIHFSSNEVTTKIVNGTYSLHFNLYSIHGNCLGVCQQIITSHLLCSIEGQRRNRIFYRHQKNCPYGCDQRSREEDRRGNPNRYIILCEVGGEGVVSSFDLARLGPAHPSE